MTIAESAQYKNLRTAFNLLTATILGTGYYNNAMDVYDCDFECCEDIINEYNRKVFRQVKNPFTNKQSIKGDFMPIKFYRTQDPYGCFSNFSKHPIEMDGKTWPTTEHYFQSQKFHDPELREQIRLANSAREAAELGRDRSKPLRDDWDFVKDDIMFIAVLRKFRTHKDIAEILLSTGDEQIIENSPIDSYWGCGADGKGRDQLGKTLMQVRFILRNNF